MCKSVPLRLFLCHGINQVGVGQAGVPGWTKEHLQHTDGQSPAGVPQFRWEYIPAVGGRPKNSSLFYFDDNRPKRSSALIFHSPKVFGASWQKHQIRGILRINDVSREARRCIAQQVKYVTCRRATANESAKHGLRENLGKGSLVSHPTKWGIPH